MLLIQRLLLALAFLVLCDLASAGSACFKDPGMDQLSVPGLPVNGADLKNIATQQMNSLEVPELEVAMCIIQVGIDGPVKVLKDNCGCLEAVKKTCKFSFTRLGILFATGMGGVSAGTCMVFAPVFLTTSLLK